MSVRDIHPRVLTENPDLLLTTPEVALLTGLSPDFFSWHRWKRDLDLPVVKLGRSCRYRAGDVLAWINRNTSTKAA